MKTFITGALALFVGLFIGGLNQPPAADAVGPVVNSIDHQADTQLAEYWLWRRAADDLDPTGTQHRLDLQKMLRYEINRALDCQERIGNPWCLDEYGGDWPPPYGIGN